MKVQKCIIGILRIFLPRLVLCVLLCGHSAVEALTASTEPVAGTDDLAPDPIDVVTAEASADRKSVTLTWTLADDDFVRQAAAGSDFTSGGVFINVNDVDRYGIWRRVVGSDEPELIDEVGAGATAYVDESVIAGKSYIYLITVVDGAGNQSDAVESNQVQLGIKSVPGDLNCDGTVDYDDFFYSATILDRQTRADQLAPSASSTAISTAMA